MDVAGFNINFQLSGLIFLIIIMFFYYSKKRLNIQSNKAFGMLLKATLINVVLDIISVISITNIENISGLVNGFLNRAYLISINCICALALNYVISFHNMGEEKKRKLKIIYSVPMVISTIILIVTPLKYSVQGKLVYSYGIGVNVVYITAAIYLLLGLFYTIKHENRIAPVQRVAIYFFTTAEIITGIIQYFNRQYLLMGLFICVSMAFLYLSLENPEQNLDKTTELFNKNAFYEMIAYYIENNVEFHIITILLKNTRFINKTFGRKGMHKLLQEVASSLLIYSEAQSFLTGDFRISVIVTKEKSKAKRIAESIKKRFSKNFNIFNMEIVADAAVAFMSCPDDASDIDKIIDISEYVVAVAKEENTVVFYDEVINKKKNRREEIERIIKEAVEDNSLEVYYQPIYSTKAGKFNSAEALVRLTNSDIGFISPEEFIPVSEQNGLILDIGIIVFEQVCKCIHEKQLDKLGIEYIEINLSVVQCMQKELVQQLINLMKVYKIPSNMINLEITETATMGSKEIVQNNMDKLVENGINFSLDDYGTGYSNINYIVDFPFEIIKLDKSIVWSAFKNSKANIVMNSTIEMINELDMKVVAEGVETKEQADVLSKMGVDYLQGFFYSKPVNVYEFIEVVKSYNLK